MRSLSLGCVVFAVAASLAHAADPVATLSPEQVLRQMRDKYAALNSYADTGSVTTIYRSGNAAAITETHTFRTAYHSPRQFLLEFRKDPKAGDERFVLWSEGQDFNTWWSATKVHEDYPQGSGATAFALGALPTKGAVVMIPPLLFSKAGLQGPLANFSLTRGAGKQEIGDHICYRLQGQEAVAYKTGNVAGGRAVTLWIDAESLLVRKVFEDTPAGTSADTVSTVTSSYEPSANPVIEPARFHFELPQH
jgi:hypothetical protein